MVTAGLYVALAALVCATAGAPLGARDGVEKRVEISSRTTADEDEITKGNLCESTPGRGDARVL